VSIRGGGREEEDKKEQKLKSFMKKNISLVW
jgi:hypothetical protein